MLKFYCSVQIKTDTAKKRDIRYTHTHTHFNISVKKTEGFMWFSTQVRIGTDLHTPTVRWLLLLSDKWTVPSILSSMKNESCIYIQAGWNRTEPLRANSDVIYKKKSQSRHIWQRRVGRPWWEIYLDRDKWWNIFLQQSRCISNAPWLAYRWLLTWRHQACGGKTLPITIHACGCGKSLMSFFFLSLVISAAGIPRDTTVAHVKLHRHEQRLNLSNLSAFQSEARLSFVWL